MQAIVCRLVEQQPLEEPQARSRGLRAGRLVVRGADGNDQTLAAVVVGPHYADGTPGVYFPAGVRLPERLLREMWLFNAATGKGRLGGKLGDRVLSRKVGGVASQGVFYGSVWTEGESLCHGPSWSDDWSEGSDVAAELGILGPDRA